MRKRTNRKRTTIEWSKGSENIGVCIPWPFDILLNYLKNKNYLDIVNSFFSDSLIEVNLLDLCVLNVFWVKNEKIFAARTSWFNHPHHHSSEFIFDKEKERLKITIRQPDLDGMHWKKPHIHVIRGQIDLKDNCNILKPIFNKHIKLLRSPIKGKYIIKIK